MQEPVHIAEITEATTGGVRRHLRDLSCGLSAGGFKVTVIGSPLRDPAWENDARDMQNRGIVVHRLPMRRRIHPFADTQAFLRLRRILKAGKFDIVHTHSSKAGILGRLAARSVHTPVVLHTPHVFPFDTDAAAAARFLYLGLERLAARVTDRIVCVSEAERAAALRAGVAPASRFTVIHNGVEAPPPPVDRSVCQALRQELAIPMHAPLVGTVGRLSAQKGLPMFLDAARQVLRKLPDVRFVIIGDGEQGPRLRQQARTLGVEQAVCFAGARENIGQWLGVLDLFVLPSAWESLPYALLEAMAASRPCVATAVGGIPEVIDDGDDGILVPPAGPQCLADAIVTLIENPALRQSVGTNACRKITRRFPLARMLETTAALYRRMLDENRHGG